jgi:hypothetical protein
MVFRRRIQLSTFAALAATITATSAFASPGPPNSLPTGPAHWTLLWTGEGTLPVFGERAFDVGDGIDTVPLNPDEPFDDRRGDNVPTIPERSFDADDRGEAPTLPEAEPRSETLGLGEIPHAYPNPSFGPVTIELGADDLSVEVYDLAGRRVAHVSGRTGRAVWDGRDEFGQLAPSGVYFARVKEEGAPGRTVRLVRR